MNRIVLDDRRDYLLWREGSGGTVEIFDLQVGSERRVGRGRRLVETLLDHVRGRTHLVWALTRTGNYRARQFYGRLEFKELAELPGFYTDESAVLVARGP